MSYELKEKIKEIETFANNIDEWEISKKNEILKKHLLEIGAINIKEYYLISNYGFTFFIYGVKCDLRFWANCYGVSLNKWSITYNA